MKVGDYVRMTDARDDDLFLPHDGIARTGIIIDAIELPDGFSEYEVLLEDGVVMWCSDLTLKVLSASR